MPVIKTFLGVAAVVATAAGTAWAQDRFMAPLPPDTDLTITRDAEYANAGGRSMKFDLYRPSIAKHPGRVPVVIFFNGVGADWLRGHVQYTSWPRYVTTAGLAGISMDATEATAAEDFDRLVEHLTRNGERLGIDAGRIVVWACSANVSKGLPLVEDARRASLAGAVMYYGSGDVRSYRLDLPVLLVRAGLDNPGLNRNIDAIAAAALAANAPVSVVNHPSGKHGFDLRDDNEITREVMARTLDFMRQVTRPENIAARGATLDAARGAAALFAQDWPTAVQAFERMAAASPADPEPQQRLGEALMALGDYRRAIPALERSIALGTPNRGIVRLALVRAHVKAGDIDGAMKWLEEMKPFFRFFGEQLKTHPDFEPLRADARFAKIMGGPF